MMYSKRVVSFVNPHLKTAVRSDPHYNEKLDDDYHLLDIINIMNYLAIINEDNEEIRIAENERQKLLKSENRPLRLSNASSAEK